MLRKLNRLEILTRTAGRVFLVAALICAIAACENEVLPTGDLIAQGGAPGGSTLGGGGGAAAFPAFDINNLPTPKFWNDLGGYEKLPDLFTFANGRKVTTAEDWFGTEANNYHGRRWEIEQIVQHYEYGYMPDYGDKLTVTWTQTSDIVLQINLSYNGNAGIKTAGFSITATIPAGEVPEGGFPAIINCGSGGAVGWSNARDGRYAGIGFNVDNAAAESSHAGVVDTLFGYDYTNDPNAPSIFMAYAWTAGRIMDALETEIEGSLPFEGKINVNKLLVTGMSRWGKGAEICAAFAKSKQGTQIQVCDIGSAGSGGPAIERFISPLGLHEEYSVTTTVTSNNIPGRIQYMQFIGGNQGNTLVSNTSSYFIDSGSDTSRPPYGPAYGPLGADLTTASGGYPLVVRAITPATYAELYANDATKNTVFIYDPWPYEGVFNGNYWHGQETLAQLIRGSPTWFNARFKQFKDTHYGLRVDDVGGLPTRTPDGFLSTIPYDQHFLLALIAPRAVIIHDGFRTVRNNPEGCFINHLAVDEVYKFLEEQGVRPEFADETGFDSNATLSDFNAIKYYFIPHEQPEYELKDTFDMADVYFGYKAKTEIANYQERFRDPPYPIEDPRSKHDYQKLDWARPGATPLSVQVAGVPDFPYETYKLTKWADQTE
jgi:hypothetical protein